MKKLVVVLVLIVVMGFTYSDLTLANGTHIPPGLERTEGVPPGLEKKGGLPPGQAKKVEDEDKLDELTKKDPILGASRSLFLPGLGQYYVGDQEGAQKFIALEAVGAGLLYTFSDHESTNKLIGAGLIGLRVVSAVDAYDQVLAYNQKLADRYSLELKEDGARLYLGYEF
ncbi:hypothetical protein MWH28_07140 [Natroniella sulfidigena]|uniref:hypothetical protein n=1 Tax=Natroniella sulfidigena TaxID=723921 RepID=UPI002009EDE5|nr:hypothetical protein [Natroniella sulfidigena]MCK8817133.1 hypothetical protein [Natroniella sulfidigena]